MEQRSIQEKQIASLTRYMIRHYDGLSALPSQTIFNRWTANARIKDCTLDEVTTYLQLIDNLKSASATFLTEVAASGGYVKTL